MYDKDEIKRTLQYGEAALNHIKRNGLPAFPRHYELWYAYSAGLNCVLNQTVNEILRARGRVSLEELQDIYQRFMAPNRLGERVEEVSAGINFEIETISSAVDHSIEATQKYATTLNSASHQLGASKDPNRIQAIVLELVQKTNETETINRELEGQLADSRCQIDELQQNLDAIRFESLSDELTTLANRKHFDQSIERLLREAQSGKQSFALVMTDIDYFKLFNDNFGHQTGDQVLRLVGLSVKQMVRAADIPCRYGGEEFGILLPGATLEQARLIAESIRTAVMSKDLVKRSTGENLGNITISAGVSSWQPGDSTLSIIERADEALYAAKHCGRNKVCTENDREAA